jgi:hypothetical protein
MNLLTTCIHHSELQFINLTHTHTHTNVLSLLYSPLAVSYQRLLRHWKFFSFPCSDPLVTTARAEYLSTDNSTDWDPGLRPFHTNLPHSPTSYFTSLHLTKLLTSTTARLVSSFYNLWADPIENTASNNPSIFVMGGCLAIDFISILRERVYLSLLRNGCLFMRLMHIKGCKGYPFRGLCPATGLYVTVLSAS